MGLEGHIGKAVPPSAEPGDSMRGVDAAAPMFSGSVDGTTGKYDLPVDTEDKATTIKIFSVKQPHMRAFHLMWISFFTSFVSTFAAAPLIAIVRDDISLTKNNLVDAGVAAVTGTIFARVVMGTFCDTFGPRYGHALLMLGTSPAVFCMSLVKGPSGFIAMRCCIGFSLATFVATQYWSSQMFTPKLVGIANATTAGWGNLGGGVTNLVMPFIFNGIYTGSVDKFQAWRLAFFVPGAMHIIVGILVLFFSQDLPAGTYATLRREGKLAKPDGAVMAWGVKNYRMWCLTVAYGFCFGVELTMNNVAAPYFFDHFGLNLRIAGILGSCFGLMNLFARSVGGYISDRVAKPYGMRGRLWVLWIIQTVEGALCVLMGLAHKSLALTIVIMICFSIFVQAAEGASYGVVPFVSKRALGVVSGFVGAGGNAGSSITQTIFFKNGDLETYEAIMYMGVMIMAVTAVTIMPIHFPQWGGMFTKPSMEATEEDYYCSDYTEEEKAEGKHKASLVFAANVKTERGTKAPNAIEMSGQV